MGLVISQHQRLGLTTLTQRGTSPHHSSTTKPTSTISLPIDFFYIRDGHLLLKEHLVRPHHVFAHVDKYDLGEDILD